MLRMGKTWVLIAAILGSSMSFIDGTAVNVALPVMQRDLHATSGQMQWVIEGYSLFLSALILIGGSLGDVLGRKKMFAWGIALFALASIGCAFAPSIDVLIAARCLQGAGGALAMPESLALISAVYDGEARGRAIGTWSGFASITGAAGPVIGGYLAQTSGWRGVFIINIPLAILVLIITFARVPESRDEAAGRTIDFTGAALATLGLGGIVFGLIRFQTWRFDWLALATFFGGAIVLGLFVVSQRRERHPMMPLAIFRSRTFSVANIYTLLLYAAIGGSLYFLPFNLVDVQQYTPAEAGASLLPFVFIQFALSRWSGGLMGRIGARIPLVAGAVLAGAGFLAFALPGIGGNYWTTYFPAALLLGFGGALFIAPLTTTVFDGATKEQSGIASGINNAVARTAALVAIAALGIVLSQIFDRGFDARMGRQHLSAATQTIARNQRPLLLAGTVPPEVPAADREKVATAIREGYSAGFRAVMVLSALISFAAALVALLFLPARSRAAIAPAG